jgi:hypothetical protein
MWLGLLDQTQVAVLSDPVRIKTGIMTNAAVTRTGSQVAIEMTVDVDLQNAQTAPFRITDHQRIYPDDMFSSFMVELANKPQGLERGGAGQRGPASENIPERERRYL